MSDARDSLFAYAETIGSLRELTEGLPDDTPLVVVVRKAHDPDHFYETVAVEDGSMVDLTGGYIVLTVPEPRDVGV